MIENSKAFWFALGYVGLGSLALLTMFPKDIFYTDYSVILVLLTIPTNIISLGIRYSCKDCFIYIILSQLLFLLIWYKILKSRL
jgi:hypothetical protein